MCQQCEEERLHLKEVKEGIRPPISKDRKHSSVTADAAEASFRRDAEREDRRLAQASEPKYPY